jgi:SAM-dependent methyltransferase
MPASAETHEHHSAAIPDLARARRQYRRRANRYDRATRLLEPVRRHAVARLELQIGQTVVDVGCGTGTNFARVLGEIGPTGCVVGIEPSAAMLDLAVDRVLCNGWTNVELVHASASKAVLTAPADAALFSFTHDVLRASAAIDNILAQARAGVRVVAAGAKWTSRWAVPFNVATWAASRRYVTTFEGFGAPWDKLVCRLERPQVETMWFGAAFVARGYR